MERIIQQDGTGCGIACVAMLVGEEYETVRDQAIKVLPPLFNDGFGKRRGGKYSLRTCDYHLHELLGRYGLGWKYTVTCKEWMRDQPMRFEDFARYITKKTKANGRNAIVATHRRNHAGILGGQPVDNDKDRCHWVVWDGEQCCIHDPQNPPNPNIRPWFYMYVS